MVQRHTDFHLEEMLALIEAAHQQSRDDGEMLPAVGHDVKVSNLFEVRDFWEWLASGYTDPSTRPYYFSNVAFASFSSFQGYRDFLVQLETGSTQKTRVWVRGPKHTSRPRVMFLGTLITKQRFDTVTQGQLPKLQARAVSECKTTREEKCMKSLHQVSNGKYAKQFPPDRVADGLAMCERRWEHFSNSMGAWAPSLQLLVHELAAELLRRKPRTGMHDVHEVSEVHAEQQEAARFTALLVDAPPPALQNRQHAGAQFYEFKQGDRTEKGYLNTRAPTDAEFHACKSIPWMF